MTNMARVLVLGCAVLLSACATSAFDRHFDARRWSDAAAAFTEDSALHEHPRTLYRAALMHATPGTDLYDPARASTLLDRLFTTGTGGPAADPAVRTLHAVLVELERDRSAAALNLDSITAEADRLRTEVDELEARLVHEKQATQNLSQVVQRLTSELRAREEQLVRISEELAQLKAIDLQRPSLRTR